MPPHRGTLGGLLLKPAAAARAISVFEPLQRHWRSIFVGALVALIGFVGLGTDLVRRRFDDLAQARTTARNIARLLEENTTNSVGSVEHVLSSLAEDLHDVDFTTPGTIQPAFFKDALRANPQIQSLWLFDAKGRLIASTTAAAPRGESFADREYFATHVHSPQAALFVGPPVQGRLRGLWFVPISIRLTRPDGSFAGVLQASVEPDYFRQLHESVDLGQNGAITLITAGGRVVARTPEHKEAVGRFLVGPLQRHYRPSAPTGDFIGVSPFDGIERITAYRAVPRLPLVVLVGVATADALASWRASLPVYGIIAVLLIGGCVLGISLSIRHTEHQLLVIRLRQEREAAQQLAQTRTAFLAHMSHDLRTPLNAIIGFSEIMASAAFGPLGHPRYQEYTGDVLAAGRHMLALINDLLDLSRIELARLNLDEQEIEVQELLAASIRLVSPQADAAGVRLQVDQLLHGLCVHGDERRLKQVLTNVLSNAVKFTPRGGQVQVSATNEPDLGAVIRVSDTGIGMQPDEIEVALEPWKQVESTRARRYEGTGLGLPLSKRLMELHGGTLIIESASGQGTEICLRLPTERIAVAATMRGATGAAGYAL